MDELRIGDRERDEAVHCLGEEYAAGRLTREEYDERTDAVWSARTAGDLGVLFDDLVQRPSFLAAARRPQPAGVPPWARGGPGRRPGRAFAAVRRLPTPLLVAVVVVLALVAMAVPFPIWVIGLVWLVVVRGGRHGCGPRARWR